MKYCQDCKWSIKPSNLLSILECAHPKVKEGDPIILARENRHKDCLEERMKGWLQFPACGKKGNLWQKR